jgi:hypothetical protein
VGYLGQVPKKGALDPNNPVLPGGWTIAFDPEDIGIRVESEIYHIAIKGPAGSAFEVFKDTTFYDAVARGDKNSWDPAQAMAVQPGSTIFFYYNSAASPAPMATLFFREPRLF